MTAYSPLRDISGYIGPGFSDVQIVLHIPQISRIYHNAWNHPQILDFLGALWQNGIAKQFNPERRKQNGSAYPVGRDNVVYLCIGQRGRIRERRRPESVRPREMFTLVEVLREDLLV